MNRFSARLTVVIIMAFGTAMLGTIPSDFLEHSQLYKNCSNNPERSVFDESRLGDWGDLTFTSSKLAFGKMTEEERINVFGYVGTMPGGHKAPKSAVSNIATLLELRRKKGLPYTDDINELAKGLPEGAFISFVTSLITGKPMEFNHKEFSPGNAYIVRISDPKLISILQNQQRQARKNSKLGPSKRPAVEEMSYYYYRLYGQSGILAESFTSIFAEPNKP